MTKSILVCSPVGNPHIIKQLKILKEACPDLNVDFMSLSYVEEKYIPELLSLVGNAYLLNKPRIRFNLIVKVAQLIGILRFRRLLTKNYNCIIINAITTKYRFLFSVLRKKSHILVLIPWGSEVLRASARSLNTLKKFYSQADYVTTVRHSRFEKDMIKFLNINESKLVDLPNGTKLIDMHITRHLEKDVAKRRMGLENKYIVTIGYNGYRTQNHIAVLDSLIKVSEYLPSNTHIVLPATYGFSKDYEEELVSKLEETGFGYSILKNFMENDHLYELQCSTDIFIHMQKTDASSASVKEFILAGTVVFNGAWLEYPEIEVHGKPYIVVEDFSDLNNKLKMFLTHYDAPHITEEMCKDIKKFSYSTSVKNWQEAVRQWIS